MADQTILYTFRAENSQALRAVRELSKGLQDQREQWKQSIYDERSRRSGVIAQIKKQELAILSLAKEDQKAAKEKIRLLKAEEAAYAASSRQRITAEQARLRLLERKEVGVTGLDRMSIPGGLLPGFGGIASRFLPKPLMQAIANAQGRTGGRIAGNAFASATQSAQAIAGASNALGGVGTAALGLTSVLGTAGLLGAMAIASVGVQRLSEAFKEAGQVQQNTISDTTAFAREFKLSRDEAKKFAIENQVRVEKLGAALPISATDINTYASVMNNAGVGKMLRGNKDDYKRLVIGDEKKAGVATRFALLRQSLGNRVNDAQAAGAASLLANRKTRLKDLNIEFFKTSGLYDQLKKEGFDSLRGAARLEAVNRALANLVPDEAIRDMAGTLDATVSSLNDRLFSPRTGLFGALRPLENLGGKSLYEEISRALGDSSKVMEGGSLSMIWDAFRPNKRGGIGEVLGKAFNELLDGIINNPGIITAFTSQLANEIGSFLGTVNWGKLALSLGMLFVDLLIAIPAGLLALGGGWIRSAIGTISEAAIQSFQSVVSTVISWIKNLFGAITAPLSAGINIGSSIAQLFGLGGNAKNAAGGYLPIGSAIAAELQAKPANSGLIIANTSEAILNRDQQSQLLSRAGGATIAPTINIYQQPGENAEQLADRVISLIGEMVRRERNYHLA